MNKPLQTNDISHVVEADRAHVWHHLVQHKPFELIDPRVIDLVHCAHVEAAAHLQLLPGTNVALINALAHVVVTEGLTDDAFAITATAPPDP